jgi:hypothetical protein
VTQKTIIVIQHGERLQGQEAPPQAQEAEEGCLNHWPQIFCGSGVGARDWPVSGEGLWEYIYSEVVSFTEWMLGRFQ